MVVWTDPDTLDLGPHHPNTLLRMHNLADMFSYTQLNQLKRHSEADESLRRRWRSSRRTLSTLDLNLATTFSTLGWHFEAVELQLMEKVLHRTR